MTLPDLESDSLGERKREYTGHSVSRTSFILYAFCMPFFRLKCSFAIHTENEHQRQSLSNTEVSQKGGGRGGGGFVAYHSISHEGVSSSHIISCSNCITKEKERQVCGGKFLHPRPIHLMATVRPAGNMNAGFTFVKGRGLRSIASDVLEKLCNG